MKRAIVVHITTVLQLLIVKNTLKADDNYCLLYANKPLSSLDLTLNITFAPTIKTRKTLGDRAFCVAAPTVWNNLPKSIRKEQDFKKFKSLLKTFLFKTAYN